MRWLVAILVVCLAQGSARADDSVGYGTAHALALGGTAAIVPPLFCISNTESADTKRTCRYLALGAVLFGPSLGRWYARDPAIGGILLRGAGVGLAVALAAGSDGEGEGLVLAALSLVVVGTVFDIGKTSCSVNAYNERALKVLPAVGDSPGVSLVGTF